MKKLFTMALLALGVVACTKPTMDDATPVDQESVEVNFEFNQNSSSKGYNLSGDCLDLALARGTRVFVGYYGANTFLIYGTAGQLDRADGYLYYNGGKYRILFTAPHAAGVTNTETGRKGRVTAVSVEYIEEANTVSGCSFNQNGWYVAGIAAYAPLAAEDVIVDLPYLQDYYSSTDIGHNDETQVESKIWTLKNPIFYPNGMIVTIESKYPQLDGKFLVILNEVDGKGGYGSVSYYQYNTIEEAEGHSFTVHGSNTATLYNSGK